MELLYNGVVAAGWLVNKLDKRGCAGMDYFRLNNGKFIRVIDIEDGEWIIDMEADGTSAWLYYYGGLHVPMRNVAYEIDAVEMAIYMLESMMQMEWTDSGKVNRAIGDLMDRFKDELVFNVNISLGTSPLCKTFTIDIRDLSPYAVSKVVVWNYIIG